MSEERTPRLTGVPAKRSNAVALKARLIAIFSIVILALLLGPLSIAISLSNKPTPIPDNIGQAMARGPAEEVAKAWLKGENIPVGVSENVPTGALSAADNSEGAAKTFSYESLAWNNYTTDSLIDGTQFELHHFLIVAKDPASEDPKAKITYDLAVTMLLTNDKPVLASIPSIAPYVPANSKYKFDYSTVAQRVDPSQQVSDVLQQWATAYATNDTAQLGLVVADPQKGVYDGVQGFTSGTLTPIYTLSAGEDVLLVRARVSLVSANGFTSEAEYDLLVSQASSGSPHVVAWGAAGAGNKSDFIPYEFNRRPL